MKILILFIMLFLHLVDDYYLQGILASMKQKKWWEEQTTDPKYRNDYKIALAEHAFSWTFMIMLPAMVLVFYNKSYYESTMVYTFCFMLNCTIHCIVDDLKANKLKINLVQDQLIHIIQVIVTWFLIFIL